MEPLQSIIILAELIEKLGFPVWAAVVLWAAVKFNRTVHDGLTDLRMRDASLQKALEEHIAKADVRIALIEQLLRRHDASLESLWERLEINGRR